MIYVGSTKIGTMSLGSTGISMAYIGSDLVYQKTAPVFYDRLVFDGTAYIETDITPVNGDSFNVILGNEKSKIAQRVFVMDGGSGTTIGLIYTSSTTSTNRRMGVYYATTSNLSNRNYAFSNTEYNFFLTPSRYGWGSTSYTISKGNYSITSSLMVGTNVSHSGQAFTGRMGTFYVYGSDASGVTTASGFSSYTPKYTLRPCTYNGIAGMWCVENKKFYGNSAGSGTLSVVNL